MRDVLSGAQLLHQSRVLLPQRGDAAQVFGCDVRAADSLLVRYPAFKRKNTLLLTYSEDTYSIIGKSSELWTN